MKPLSETKYYLTVIITLIVFSSSISSAFSPITRIEMLEKVEVSKNSVYLSDLMAPNSLPADWMQHLASIYIGEAPEPGAVKYVQVELLKSYIKQVLQGTGQDLEMVKIVVPDEIIITRKAVSLSNEEIETFFKHFIWKNAPWKPENIDIQKVRYSGLAIVPEGERNFEGIADPKERFLGPVTITLNVMVEGKRVRSLRVSGIVDVYDDVFHAKKIIPKGTILGAEHLEIKRARITDDPKVYSKNEGDVLGKRALKDIYPEEPIKLSDLDNPIVVAKGDVVRLMIDRPGILLTAKGEIKEEGRIGDRVKVMNLSSKKIIQGRVRDRETVIVE